MTMYERRHEPLLTRAEFAWRVVRHVVLGLGAVAVALGMGIAGYRYIVHDTLDESILNASMILGGMGPVGKMPEGKPAVLFASGYALFSGLFFIAMVGLLLAPFLHRLAHTLHLQDK